jgi:prophage tail gpP-like protein
VLSKAGLLAWSSADGKELIVGKPNYEQEPQWSFLNVLPGGQRENSPTILDLHVRESSGERYSQITVCGTGKGNDSNYGPNVTQKKATVRDSSGPAGTGGTFAFPKRLLIADSDITTQQKAQERALREKALRDAQALEVVLELESWSSAPVSGGKPVVYHTDRIFHLEDEESGINEDFLVTRVDFAQGSGMQACTIRGVPRGTELRAA